MPKKAVEPIKVNFLRKVRPAPEYLSPFDQVRFKKVAEDISKALEEPSFVSGRMEFMLDKGISNTARVALKDWLEGPEEGYMVKFRGANGRNNVMTVIACAGRAAAVSG